VIKDEGINVNTADAVQNLALLEAFYLDDREKAKQGLENLINSPRMPKKTISETKLVLGDIYLLDEEPWEASLIYSQVEKAEKETETGHEAKLRNAKLSYFVGEFELAKGHLDVLKMATSREIANDAMDLSLLIQDNLELDTSSTAMELYAAIDLLMFQNKVNEALSAYDSMLVTYEGHSLTDEILWQKSQLLLKLGKYQEAVKQLEIILKDYLFEITADDANFMLGEIHEKYLNDKEKAMEYYQNQFTKTEFDGSLYMVEARKRFRKLRGDKL
jgi:predicted Zn-dependent protease